MSDKPAWMIEQDACEQLDAEREQRDAYYRDYPQLEEPMHQHDPYISNLASAGSIPRYVIRCNTDDPCDMEISEQDAQAMMRAAINAPPTTTEISASDREFVERQRPIAGRRSDLAAVRTVANIHRLCDLALRPSAADPTLRRDIAAIIATWTFHRDSAAEIVRAVAARLASGPAVEVKE